MTEPMVTGTTGYRGSGLTALVGTDALVLLAAEPDAELVVSLWPMVTAGASWDEFVATLLAVGVPALPALGLVYRAPDDDTITLLLRGHVSAVVECADGTVETLTTERITTWLERPFERAKSVELRGGSRVGGRIDGGGSLPVLGGIVRAGSVRRDWTQDVAGPIVARRASAYSLPSWLDASASVPIWADVIGIPDAPAAVPVTPSVVATVLDEPGEPAATGSARGSGDAIEIVSLTDPEVTEPDVPEPNVVDDDTADGDGDEELAFDESRPEPESAVAIGEPIIGESPSRNIPGTGLLLDRIDWGLPGSTDAPTPVFSAPERAVDAATSTDEADDVAGGDHDNRTRLSNRPKETTVIPDRNVLTVFAVTCPNGHANPPPAVSCRVCHSPIEENQSPSEIPQPVVGHLRQKSDGATFPLRSRVLIGREPRLEGRDMTLDDASSLTDVAFFRIESGAARVSRTHLEVRVTGWTVEVIDLSSTHTEVVNPGGRPMRLRPGHPIMIVPGAEIVLADEVTLAYEVTE